MMMLTNTKITLPKHNLILPDENAPMRGLEHKLSLHEEDIKFTDYVAFLRDSMKSRSHLESHKNGTPAEYAWILYYHAEWEGFLTLTGKMGDDKNDTFRKGISYSIKRRTWAPEKGPPWLLIENKDYKLMEKGEYADRIAMVFTDTYDSRDFVFYGWITIAQFLEKAERFHAKRKYWKWLYKHEFNSMDTLDDA